jgi:hypothetical protein
MTTAQSSVVREPVPNRLVGGVVGGLAGGLVFGLLMQAWDMLPMVGALVSHGNTEAGWVVHLLISALFGGFFGLTAGALIRGAGAAVGFGLLYGLLWWYLGALVTMPKWLGMDEMILKLDGNAWRSFFGHLAWGLLLGVGYALLRKRSRG